MKKRLIISLIIIVIVVLAILGVVEALSYKKVSIQFKGDGYTASIINADNKTVSTVSSSATIQLKEGDYTYKVNGANFDNSAQSFTVKGNSTDVVIDPQYSSDYLNNLLSNEQDSIETVLKNSYPQYASQLTFNTLKLYDKGEWAAGTFSYSVDPRDIPDVYRFVLMKENSVWQIVVSPQIAINKAGYKTVPDYILNSLYSSTTQ